MAQRLRFSDQNVTLPGEPLVQERLSDIMVGAAVNWTPQWGSIPPCSSTPRRAAQSARPLRALPACAVSRGERSLPLPAQHQRANRHRLAVAARGPVGGGSSPQPGAPAPPRKRRERDAGTASAGSTTACATANSWTPWWASSTTAAAGSAVSCLSACKQPRHIEHTPAVPDRVRRLLAAEPGLEPAVQPAPEYPRLPYPG
jgi:hypothetical protein